CPNCQRVNIVPTGEAPARPVEAVQTSGPAPGPAPEADKGAVRADRRERRDDPDERDDQDRRARGRRRDRDEDDRAPVGPPRTSGKAVTSLILGLLSIICLLNIFTGLPAVILGALALKEIGQNERRVGGRGLALGGIITGVLGLVVLFPTLVLAGLLIPAVMKVREAGARMQSSNNLQLMSVGLLNYHDVHR